MCYNRGSLINKAVQVLEAPARPLTKAKDEFAMATSNRTDSIIEIQLTKGHVAVVDACDSDLAQLKWCAAVRGTVYAVRGTGPRKKRRYVHLHRLVLERILGRALRPDEYVDHIDCNGLNNRRGNLRLATISQNNRNRRKQKNTSSSYKGVSWHKRTNKWQAVIRANDKQEYLGLFDTPIEAHEAYKVAANRLFGEFARYE
jgi:hypothetical protein